MSFNPNNFDPDKHSDSNSSGSDILPTGEYVAMVKSFKRNVRRGKSQIDFTIKAVLDKDRNRVSAEYAPLWETVTIQENAIWRLANLCKAAGQSTPFNIDNDSELASAVKGKPIKVRVIHETYQGQKKARLKNYIQLNDGDAKAFESAMEDMAMDNSADTGGSYSGENSVDNNGSGNDFTDDDIPF